MLAAPSADLSAPYLDRTIEAPPPAIQQTAIMAKGRAGENGIGDNRRKPGR